MFPDSGLMVEIAKDVSLIKNDVIIITVVVRATAIIDTIIK